MMDQHEVSHKPIEYAGFWLRLLALFLDAIMLGIVDRFVQQPLLKLFGIYPPSPVSVEKQLDIIDMIEEGKLISVAEILQKLFDIPFSHILSIVVFSSVMRWLYYVLFEISAWQATPGKYVLNVRVADSEGNKLNFVRASLRHFCKYISDLTLLLGYIMAGFTSRKQALHDMISGCAVIKKNVPQQT